MCPYHSGIWKLILNCRLKCIWTCVLLHSSKKLNSWQQIAYDHSRDLKLFHFQKVRLLLRVEDTGHVTTEHHLINLYFSLFSSFFCLFSIVLRQLCLLHEVRVKTAFYWMKIPKLNTHVRIAFTLYFFHLSLKTFHRHLWSSDMWEYGCFGSNIIVTPMLCMVIKCCKLGCCKFTTPKYTHHL